MSIVVIQEQLNKVEAWEIFKELFKRKLREKYKFIDEVFFKRLRNL